MKFSVIIPARYASTRLPGKPLADIAGKPMVVRVAERARASGAAEVVVATDHAGIAAAVARHGYEAVMTGRDHASGTDRLAEVAALRRYAAGHIVVNVQGDEPLIDPRAIDQVVAPLVADSSIQMATLYKRITQPAELIDNNVVKVVVDRGGFALYFSRAPIPHVRDPRGGWPPLYRHIGLYAYRRNILLVLASLEATPLERAESLEQLRALEHGIRIKAVETPYDSISVDTPEDLEQVRRLLSAPTSS